MGDLKFDSLFGEFGPKNPNFSSICVVGKFKKRKVSCRRDFPVGFAQLREEIKQNSEQECSASNVLDTLKAAGMMTMKEDVKVKKGFHDHARDDNKPSVPIIRYPMNLLKRRRVSAVRDFPDAFKQLNGQKGSPKQDNVSVDYTDSTEDEIEPFETDFEHPPSSDDLEFDLLSQNFEIHEDKPLLGAMQLPDKDFDFLSHDFDFVKEEPLFSPDEEEDLQLDAESFGPLAKLEGEYRDVIAKTEGLEKPKWEDGICQMLEDKTTTKKMYPETLPKRFKVSAVRDFPDAVLQLNAECASADKKLSADEDGAYVSDDEEEPFENYIVPVRDDGAYVLDDEEELFENCMLPERCKVSAVRDLPNAFLQSNAECASAAEDGAYVSNDDEEPFENYTLPLTLRDDGAYETFENYVLPLAVRDDGAYVPPLYASSIDDSLDAACIDQGISEAIGSNKNAQEQVTGSGGLDHRIIVQALMAASRCPWGSRRTRRPKNRKSV